jgi:DHA1 family multidrug resistance protein-like MFS transporter
MTNWKRNLFVLWFGQFMVMSGMTMIIPFLPLYIQELGVTDEKQVALWAGIIFAGNFVTAFLFQPFWGRLADKYGRKMMIIRSGLGMAVVMILMGFSTSVWHLLLLRLLNGTISGYMPAAAALVSANTPRERIGFAMGTLQSGAVAGTIFGPVIGGLMVKWVGFAPIFFITGSIFFVGTLLALFMVRESFDRKQAASKPQLSIYKGLQELRRTRELPSLFAVTFMIQFAILSSMPLIPLFVQDMHGQITLLAFYAGLVSSSMGFSNMIASPLFGRLGDRIGFERILSIALIGAAIAFIPQAFVQNVWQLMTARFCLGFFIGGLLPSVNALIRTYTPDGMEGRAYSFNTSALALGNMLGPVVGGLLYGIISIRGVFILTAILLFVNFLWVRRTLISNKRQKRIHT